MYSKLTAHAYITKQALYLFKNFGEHIIQIVQNSMTITGHKNAANVIPQHKHTQKT